MPEKINTYKQALISSEELFQYSLDLMCVAGFDGYFKLLNPAWERLLGWTPQELTSKPWVEFVHPDDAGSTENARSIICEGNEVIQFENRYLCKDGTIKWLSWNTYPLPEEGLMFGVARDITQEKQNQLIQQVLFHISGSMVFTMELEELIMEIRIQLGKLIDTHNFYIALYDPHTGMLSIPYEKDEHDNIESWPAKGSATGLVIEQKRPLLLQKKEIIDMHARGEIMLIGTVCEVWLGVPLMHENQPLGAIVVQDYKNPRAYNKQSLEILEFASHQISLAIQRKQTYKELIRAKEVAEQNNRLKTAFLNNLSHEIRTPLNAIVGFSEFLNTPGLDAERIARYTGVIRRSSSQLLSIIDDIISISSIEAGIVELTEAPVELSSVIRGIYDLLQLKASSKSLKFRYLISPGLQNKIIRADETKLTQVLSNLVDNSIKYTDTGHVEFGCLQKSDKLVFYVADSGIGIERPLHEEIFERFRQGELELSRRKSGMGLGLAISRSYVELMGGTIRLVSSPLLGSVFVFDIPFSAEPDSLTDNNHPALVPSGLEVMLMMSRENTLSMVLETLGLLEVSISLVENSEELNDFIASGKSTDLVLADCELADLPACNGIIRQQSLQWPVMALCPYNQPEKRNKALEAGCIDYLSNPFTPKEFVSIVKKHLSN